MAERPQPGSRGSSLRERDYHHHHGHHHHHRHHRHRSPPSPPYRSSRPDPDSCSYKCKEFARKLVAFLFGHVGICGLVVGYIIMGAFAFMAIESEDTKRRYEDVVRLREQTILNLWNITSELNVLYPEEWNASVAAHVLHFQRKIVQFVLEGYDGKSYGNHTLINLQRSLLHPDELGGDISSSVGDQEVPVVVEVAGAWSFSASFLYCLTVITTIGYGNIAPRTTMGKLVTIAYAMVGMPLFLLYVSNMGDFLATCFRWFYVNLCKCSCIARSQQQRHLLARGASVRSRSGTKVMQVHQLQRSSASLAGSNKMDHYDPSASVHHRRNNPAVGAGEMYELQPTMDGNDGGGELVLVEVIHQGGGGGTLPDYQAATVPITISLAVMVSYIVGGAVLFKQWESEWGYLDGSYFCFISLSTTGFGDLVPGDSLITSAGGGVELSLIFCSMYLIIGMALIAMCFNLMQEEVIAKVRKCGRVLGCIRPGDE